MSDQKSRSMRCIAYDSYLALFRAEPKKLLLIIYCTSDIWVPLNRGTLILRITII